jgi:hypothetical protein
LIGVNGDARVGPLMMMMMMMMMIMMMMWWKRILGIGNSKKNVLGSQNSL